jgi:hypothetical protein
MGTFVVFDPPADLTDTALADLVIANGFAQGYVDPDWPLRSITVLGGQVGSGFVDAIRQRYPDVVVYLAPNGTVVPPNVEADFAHGGFIVRAGRYFEIHGPLTRAQADLVVRELADALVNGWRYGPGRPGVGHLNDRAHTYDLAVRLHADTIERLAHDPARLDLARLTRFSSGHAHADIVVRAVITALRTQSHLDGVQRVADLYADTDGRWHVAPVPVAVRRLYAATGPHAGAERPVRFASGAPLLSEDATALLAAPSSGAELTALTVWLAEIGVDRLRAGESLPQVRTDGSLDAARTRVPLLAGVRDHLTRLGATPDEIERLIARLLAAPSKSQMTTAIVDAYPVPVPAFGHAEPYSEIPPGTDTDQVALALFRVAVRGEVDARGGPASGSRVRAAAVRAHRLDPADRIRLADAVITDGVANAGRYAKVLAVQSFEAPGTQVSMPDTKIFDRDIAEWTPVDDLARFARDVALHDEPNMIAADGHVFVLIPAAGGVRFGDPEAGQVFQRGDIPPQVRSAGSITTPAPTPAATPATSGTKPHRTTVVGSGDLLNAIDETSEALDELDRTRLVAARNYADAMASHFQRGWTHAADPESVSLLKAQLTLMHLWLHAKLVAQADPGRARPPAVQARALSGVVANDADAELDSFRAHHEAVALEKLEESLLAAEPGLLAEFAAERELPRIPRRLGSVPIFDEHTGLPVTTVAALVTEFINPDPSAARILPRLGTAVVDRRGHITLEVLSAPAPYRPAPPTPDPVGPAPGPGQPAREPQPPWFTRDEGLIGDGYVRRVEALKDQARSDLHRDVAKAVERLHPANPLSPFRRTSDRVADWVSALVAETDPERWQDLLLKGVSDDIRSRFVRVSARLGDLTLRDPLPSDDPDVWHYKSKYGDTTYKREQTQTVSSDVSLPFTFLLRLAGAVISFVAAPIVRFRVGHSGTVSDGLAMEVQSGNRPLVNDVHDFRATVELKVEVDGIEVAVIKLPERLVVGLPTAFTTTDDAVPGSKLTVRNPGAVHAEDYGMHAVGFEPVLEELERGLKRELGLTTAEAARVIQALRAETLNEKTGKDRHPWWLANAGMSPFLDIPIGRMKRFQGLLMVSGGLTSLRRKGTTEPLLTRNDMAGTTTRHRTVGWGTRFAARVGLDLSAILNLGEFVLTPRLDAINMSTSRTLAAGHGAMAQSKVALMHKDRWRRYRAELEMSVKLVSNYGRLDRTAQARAEFAIPAERAVGFEREIQRAIVSATPLSSRPSGRPGPARWWQVKHWPVTANARELLRTKSSTAFHETGIRTAADLHDRLRYGPIEVEVPDGELPAEWAWVRRTTQVSTGSPPQRNGAEFRYVLSLDGVVAGAYRMHPDGGAQEYLANPARIPVEPIPAAPAEGRRIEPMPDLPPRRSWWDPRGQLPVRAARLRPFKKVGIRSPADLRARLRRYPIEIVVPDGGNELSAHWKRVLRHPRVRITTVTDTDRRGAFFRYLLRADGMVDGAWRLHSSGTLTEYVPNPAAERARTPIDAEPAPALPAAAARNAADLVPAMSIPKIVVTAPDGEREPWVLASGIGLGPGVVKEMPGAEDIEPLLLAMYDDQLKAAGVKLDVKEITDRNRRLQVLFATPALRGRARTMFDGGALVDEFTKGGYTFRAELLTRLGQLRESRIEAETGVDVQGRAMAGHSIHEGRDADWGAAFDGAFRAELTEDLSAHARAVEIDGGVDLGHGKKIDQAAKGYRRRATGGEAHLFDHDVEYELALTTTDSAGLTVTRESFGFSGEAYHVVVRVSAHDISPEPPRLLGPADTMQVNPAPDSLGAPISGFLHSPENMYVWLNRVSEVARVAGQVARQDLSALFTADFLEPHVTEMLGGDGYPLPLLEGSGGLVEQITVRLVPHNPAYEGPADKPRHEEYLEAGDRYNSARRRKWHLGTFAGGGGLVHVGAVHHDAQPEDDTANPYAPNHISLSGGYSYNAKWGPETTKVGGGVELSLVTEFGRSFKHTMDVVWVLEYVAQRGGHRQRASVSVLMPRGMQTSMPQVLALDLNLPVPEADRMPVQPAVPRVPIHPELVFANSFVEVLDGWPVLPRVRSLLEERGVDVDDLDMARLIKAAVGNKTLRSHYQTLRRDGVQMLVALPRAGGAIRLVGVQVTARDHDLQHQRQRPDAKVTTGGQGFSQTLTANARQHTHRLGIDLDGRADIKGLAQITGGASAGFESKNSRTHITNKTERDIRRAAPVGNESEQYEATTTFTIHVTENTVWPRSLEFLADLLHGTVGVFDSISHGWLRRQWRKLFPGGTELPNGETVQGSVRLLAPSYLSVAPGMARIDLRPESSIPETRMLRSAPDRAAQIRFSEAAAATIQALDALGQGEFVRWLPSTSLPGAHNLRTPASVRHYDPTSVAARLIQTALNRSNIRSNIAKLLRGEYPVPGFGNTEYRVRLTLGRGRWMARARVEGLNFPERSTEEEFESESARGAAWDAYFAVSAARGDDRVFAGGGGGRSGERIERIGHSAGDYVEHNALRKGDVDYFWFDVWWVGSTADGSAYVESRVEFGLVATIATKIADDLRARFPDLLESPRLPMAEPDPPLPASAVTAPAASNAANPAEASRQSVRDEAQVPVQEVPGRPDVVALLPRALPLDLPAPQDGHWQLVVPAVSDTARIPVVHAAGGAATVRMTGADLARYLADAGLIRGGRTMSLVALTGTASADFVEALSRELDIEVRVVPESARLLLRTAKNAFDWARHQTAEPSAPVRLTSQAATVSRFIDLAYPTGFRLNPASEEMYTGGTARLIEGAVHTGENAVRPPSWRFVRAALGRAGNRGLVVVLDEPRPPEVMQPSGPEIWRIVFAADGPQLHRLTGAPPDEATPRKIVAFDKCGSLLSGAGGPLSG